MGFEGVSLWPKSQMPKMDIFGGLGGVKSAGACAGERGKCSTGWACWQTRQGGRYDFHILTTCSPALGVGEL